MTSPVSENHSKGILLGFICYFCVSIMDATIKFTLTFHRDDILIIYFYMNVLLNIILLTSALLRRRFKRIRFFIPKKLPWVMSRAVSGAALMSLIFYVAPRVPLTTYYAFLFTVPIVSSILAAIFLSEKFNKDKVLALLIGFIGVIIITEPWKNSIKLPILAALIIIVLLNSYNNILANRFLKKITPLTMIFYQTTLACPTTGLYLLFTHTSFVLSNNILIFNVIAVAISVLIAYVILNVTFQRAPVQLVAPIQYTQMFWGILFGFFLFNTRPEMNIILGALLIIAINIYTSMKYILQHKK